MPTPAWARVEAAKRILDAYPRALRGPLRTVQVGENATFKVRAPRGPHALRLYRPGRWTDAEVQTEHAYARLLGRRMGVPRPARARGGGTLVEDSMTGVRGALAPWLPGRTPGRGMTLARLHQLGAKMARMHDLARGGADLGPRPAWDAEVVVRQPLAELTRGYRRAVGQRLPARVRRLGEAAAAAWGRHDDERLLVHADLHSGNLRLEGETMWVLDLDDCGMACPGYDLGVVFFYQVGFPDAEARLEALLAGYRAGGGREVSPEAVEFFAFVRNVFMAGWILERADVFAPEDMARRMRLKVEQLDVAAARPRVRQALA